MGKQEKMDNFLKKYFPDRYDELCHLAILPIPPFATNNLVPNTTTDNTPLQHDITSTLPENTSISTEDKIIST